MALTLSHPGSTPLSAWLSRAGALLRKPRRWRDGASGGRYRPELHYMRGGRTPGARSATPRG